MKTGIKNKKECLHEWEWTFVVDFPDLTCKKCEKDVFDIYNKEDANKIINENSK